MLDPITTGIIVVLGKYALDKGVELGKEVGPKALATAKEMFTATLERLRRNPKSAVIVDEYEADPETYEKPLQKKLDEAVKAEEAFKAQLEQLLKQYDEAAAIHAAATGTTYHAVLKGDGAIAQGDGATALGKQAVSVGGNADTIITGSGNVFNVGKTAVSASLPTTLSPLRDNLIRYFNKSELKGLCFDLGVAHDDLPSETRTELAQALVQHCHQRDQLPQLLRRCRTERPNADW